MSENLLLIVFCPVLQITTHSSLPGLLHKAPVTVIQSGTSLEYIKASA
ncbi:MAG TPA: hypothetical protein VMW77_06165 [Methanoregula sp.]|nr:hypothetical protein [Methanoregula sp.]